MLQFNNFSLKIGLASAALITLSGCATTRPAAAPISQSFGKAIAANLAAQKVAPTPEQKSNTYIPANRARRDLARENYEAKTIEPLHDLGTVNGT